MGIARQRTWPPTLLAAGLLAGLASLATVRPTSGADVAAESAAPRFAGITLTEAIQRLRARGLRIVFASNVVRPELRVDVEPQSADPHGALAELLAAAGLATRAGPGES